MAAAADTAPNGMPRSAFCDLVALNHGCCPACGYGWVDGACQKSDTVEATTTSAFFKSLEVPTQQGCCSFCGYEWSHSARKCGDQGPGVTLY
jgi:hypothetical protein